MASIQPQTKTPAANQPIGAAPSPSLTDASSGGGYGTPLPLVPGTPSNDPGIMSVMTPEQIDNAATTDVNNDINTQVAPLQGQYDALGTSEEKARSNLQDMFGSINPYVAQGATNVNESYNAAEGSQNAIFTQAMKQLNDLKQSRAQEAQALAQEMGGPVALSEFTAGMDDAQQGLANLGAGAQLHTLGYAQAGVQEANAWQSRVMPLIQTESQAKTMAYFEDQKKTIQDQITALKSSAGDKITQRKNDLMIQERTFALQKNQQAIDKLKDQHDWTATKITLQHDAARIKQSDRQFALDQAAQTGKYKGKPTLAAQTLTAQEKQDAQAAGISVAAAQQHKVEWAAQQKQQAAALLTQKQSTWTQYLDAATNPQVGKQITNTVYLPIPAPTGISVLKPDKTLYQNPKTGQWYRISQQTTTPVIPAISDPSKLVDFLVTHGAPKATAIRMVRTRYASPNWKYGTPLHPVKKAPQKKGPPDNAVTPTGP